RGGSAQLTLRAGTALLTGRSRSKRQRGIREDVLLLRARGSPERPQQTRRRGWSRARRRRCATRQGYGVDGDDDPIFALKKGTEALQLRSLLLLLDEQLALLLQHEILLLVAERRRARSESTNRAAPPKSASSQLPRNRRALLGGEALQDL